MSETKSNSFAVPFAIIVAGGLIALALYFSGSGGVSSNNPEQVANFDPIEIPVTDDDHVLGDINAPIKIIEYSDLECPFCKQLHPTLTQVFDEYGNDNKVAWIYRHLPLEQLHSKAIKEAEASECAAELGGNDAFWAYIERVFEVSPTNNGLDLATLPDIAEFVGLERGAFTKCLDSGKYEEKIRTSVSEGVALIEKFAQRGQVRGVGTPFTAIVVEGEGAIPVPGAQPYDSFKQFIDQALEKI